MTRARDKSYQSDSQYDQSHLHVLEQHAVDLLDGLVSSSLRLVVDETVAARLAGLTVSHHLAREDVAERAGESG